MGDNSLHSQAMDAIRGGVSLKSVPPPQEKQAGEEKVVDVASELRMKMLKRKKKEVSQAVCVFFKALGVMSCTCVLVLSPNWCTCADSLECNVLVVNNVLQCYYTCIALLAYRAASVITHTGT